MKKKDNQRRWRIELTEEQLRVAIEAIEDWHRFMRFGSKKPTTLAVGVCQ